LIGGLRAVWFESPSAVEGSSDDGTLSPSLITAKDKQFHRAIYEGLEFRVIRHEVETKYPSIPNIFQEVGNIEGAFFEGDSFVALLFKVHVKASIMYQKSGSIDWPLVKR